MSLWILYTQINMELYWPEGFGLLPHPLIHHGWGTIHELDSSQGTSLSDLEQSVNVEEIGIWNACPSNLAGDWQAEAGWTVCEWLPPMGGESPSIFLPPLSPWLSFANSGWWNVLLFCESCGLWAPSVLHLMDTLLKYLFSIKYGWRDTWVDYGRLKIKCQWRVIKFPLIIRIWEGFKIFHL